MFASYMTLRSALLCCLGSLFLAACGGGDGGPSSGTFSTNAPAAQVSARFDRFITVSARVNGVVGDFLLDSGAQAFVVDPDFVRQVGLPIVGEGQVETLSGVSSAPIARLAVFELGNIEAKDIDAFQLELGEIDGIIGEPLFRNAVVTINYQGGFIGLESRESSVLPQVGAVRLNNMRFEGIVVNGVELGELLLDTGSSGGIFVAPGVIPLEENTVLTQTAIVTVNGVLAASGFVAEDVRLGEITLGPQFVVVQQRGARFGLVGNTLLQSFTLVIDAGGNKVFFLQP